MIVLEENHYIQSWWGFPTSCYLTKMCIEGSRSYMRIEGMLEDIIAGSKREGGGREGGRTVTSGFQLSA